MKAILEGIKLEWFNMKRTNFHLTVLGMCLGMIVLIAFQAFYTSKSAYINPQRVGEGGFYVIKSSPSPPSFSITKQQSSSQHTKKSAVTKNGFVQWKLYGKGKLRITSETTTTETQGFNVKKQHFIGICSHFFPGIDAKWNPSRLSPRTRGCL